MMLDTNPDELQEQQVPSIFPPNMHGQKLYTRLMQPKEELGLPQYFFEFEANAEELSVGVTSRFP